MRLQVFSSNISRFDPKHWSVSCRTNLCELKKDELCPAMRIETTVEPPEQVVAPAWGFHTSGTNHLRANCRFRAIPVNLMFVASNGIKNSLALHPRVNEILGALPNPFEFVIEATDLHPRAPKTYFNGNILITCDVEDAKILVKISAPLALPSDDHTRKFYEWCLRDKT